MHDYLKTQKKKIEIDKWNEGCRINNDPGQEYILSWIDQNAHWFRQKWEKSLCKDCRRLADCGIELRSECETFHSDDD